MPSNRFDTSQQQQYVSSYVPLPFEQIGTLGAKMQQKYDSDIADTYKLNDLMSQVPAIHDPQLGLSNIKKKQELDAKYHPVIQGLTDKIVAGDPNASRELEQVKRQFFNDPDRQELENSYLNYKAYKEDKTKKGGKYDPLLDDYYGQQLVGEDGSLKPFRYSGMEDSLDIEARFSKAMDGIKEDIKGWDVERLGADGIKIGSKGKQAGITPNKVMGVAKDKVSDMLKLTDEGKQFAKKLRKLNPGISDDQILNEGVKALFSSASEQIGSEKTSGNSISLTDMWSRNQDNQDEEASFNRLPMHELPVQTPGEVSNKDALNVFGLGSNLNKDGKFDYNTKVQSTSVKGPGLFNAPVFIFDKSNSKENTQKLTEFYTGLNNTAKNLGIQIPKLKDGKTDYDKLQQTITEVGKNMLINGQVGQGLQAELSNNISSYYLGTVDSKGEGFKKSPFLETAKITETGNPSNQIIDDENKSKIAENGVIKDINFYAENPGTFVITTNDGEKSKNYDIYLGEKVSKALIEPTWNLTKSFERNAKGQIKPEEVKQLQNVESSIGNSLIKQYQNIQNPKLQQYLLDNLKNTLDGTQDMKTTQVVNSAERLSDGSPKYVFIGKQGFDSENNKPIEKVIAINKSNGSVELMDLNEVQAMESSFIQKQISTGYKPKLAKDER
jgi:hypothetical protein